MHGALAACSFLGVPTLSSPGLQAHEPPGAAFICKPLLNSREGHVTLEWRGSGDLLEFQLQSAENAHFVNPTIEYQGADQSCFQSGLPDGHYYYRVRARQPGSEVWGPWSERVQFICKHHSLAFAWILFGSGGVVFASIVLFVCLNARHLERFETGNA